MTFTIRKLSLLSLTLIVILPLTACGSTGKKSPSPAEYESEVVKLERVYNADRTNEEAAIKYSTALRDANRLNRAYLVMTPLAEKSGQDNPKIFVEYSSLLAASGNFKGAESYANKAIRLDPNSGEAYNALGNALEAQNKHIEAETALRTALEKWKGNALPVLNNLGLNLAVQGKTDEALAMLAKANELSPGHTEVERNIRIVSALRLEGGAKKPGAEAPTKKPADTPKPETKPKS